MVQQSSAGCVAVVADGLGSARYGKDGANAACAAGREAARLVRRYGVVPSTHTIAVLRAAWHHLVAPVGIEHCGTTCLFSLIDNQGFLFAAQIGDGIVAIRHADGHVTTLESKDKAFQNETETIASAGAQHWAVMNRIQLTPGDALLMATDGIADDLEIAKLGDFIGYLLTEYLPMPRLKRSAAVRRSLDRWPTRHHRDDKTLVVIARTE